MARIVELAGHPAVYAGRLLAEGGHEVIRVEPPAGDALRRIGPYLGKQPNVEHGAFHQFHLVQGQQRTNPVERLSYARSLKEVGAT